MQEMMMKIDGTDHCVEIGDCRAGWCDVFVIGKTLSGRNARVSRHCVPQGVLDYGGKVRTGGHVYEVRLS